MSLRKVMGIKIEAVFPAGTKDEDIVDFLTKCFFSTGDDDRDTSLFLENQPDTLEAYIEIEESHDNVMSPDSDTPN